VHLFDEVKEDNHVANDDATRLAITRKAIAEGCTHNEEREKRVDGPVGRGRKTPGMVGELLGILVALQQRYPASRCC